MTGKGSALDNSVYSAWPGLDRRRKETRVGADVEELVCGMTRQLVEKVEIVGGSAKSVPQGLKPGAYVATFMARLKPRPFKTVRRKVLRKS
jgi:hypothetical protein